MDSCPESAATVLSLARLRKGARGVVVAVLADSDAIAIGDVAGSTVERRLIEVGFVPGEPVEIIEEIRPGGDPIAVRVGSSIFALRRREARAVQVRLEEAPSRCRADAVPRGGALPEAP